MHTPKSAVESDAKVRGERALIAGLRGRAARQGARLDGSGVLRLGIGDDCAILRARRGDELVITTDMFLEQVHFRRDWHQPEVAGHRCLARGLSDIAAMGAKPVAAFLSFALPKELAGEWGRRFVDGLLRLARVHDVPLAGGDTAQAGGGLFAADIVLVGSVGRGKALLRAGAAIGDLIYVTGALGGAAAELRQLEQDAVRYAPMVRARKGHPHLFPQPRVEVGEALLGRATAAIDLSDGLSTDLAHLCRESGVAAEIETSRVPVHRLAALSSGRGLELALHGGEDYELLFTAPRRRRIEDEIGGVAVQCIGRIVKAGRGRPRVSVIDGEGRRTPLGNGGWEHFTR